jgi:hypothetical protein
MTVLRGLIGGKMIVAPVLHVPAVTCLSVIAVIIARAVAASLNQGRRQTPRAAPGARRMCRVRPRRGPA